MNKIVITIIVTLLSIVFLDSCCTEEYFYKWTDFKLENLDNSGTVPQSTTVDSIYHKAFGIRVNLTDTVWFTACNNIKLINQAYATSCGEHYTREHNLTAIKIFTIFDLNSQYPANSEVTAIFKYRQSEITNSNYVNLNEIITYINSVNNPKGNYYASNTSYLSFDMFLLTNLEINKVCKFRISIEFSDNKIFTHETNTVKLY